MFLVRYKLAYIYIHYVNCCCYCCYCCDIAIECLSPYVTEPKVGTGKPCLLVKNTSAGTITARTGQGQMTSRQRRYNLYAYVYKYEHIYICMHMHMHMHMQSMGNG